MAADIKTFPVNCYQELDIWNAGAKWDAEKQGVMHTFAAPKQPARLEESPLKDAGTLNGIPVVHLTTYSGTTGLPEDPSVDIIVSRLMAQSLVKEQKRTGAIYAPDLASGKVSDDQGENAGTRQLERFQESQHPERSYFVSNPAPRPEDDGKGDDVEPTPPTPREKALPLNCNPFVIRFFKPNDHENPFATWAPSGYKPKLQETPAIVAGYLPIPGSDDRIPVIFKRAVGLPIDLPPTPDKDICVGMELGQALANTGRWRGAIFGPNTGNQGGVFHPGGAPKGTESLFLYQPPAHDNPGHSFFVPTNSEAVSAQ